MTDTDIVEHIPVKQIAPNPYNPRSAKRFEGKAFEDFKRSIAAVGVQQPILIRPVGKKKHQIVFGERRWRAVSELAEKNGGVKDATIRAFVKDMTDDEAFELCMIENLEREDLTELEEAQGFKSYVDRKGEASIPELAERTGIDARYIRRRIAVLTLEPEMLKAWDAGKILYGHLEQLMRITDPEMRKATFNDVMSDVDDMGYCGGLSTVKDLKEQIDSQAPKLADALFNKKESCKSCTNSTDVQRTLFGTDIAEKAKCLNAECFKEKQRAWLTENWASFAKSRKLDSNGFVFYFEDKTKIEFLYEKLAAKCKECQYLITTLRISGDIHHKYGCSGDKSCYNAVYHAPKTEKKGKNKEAAGSGTGSAPIHAGDGSTGGAAPPLEEPEPARVPWHGEYFRELFFADRLPKVTETLVPQVGGNDIEILRLALMAIMVLDVATASKFANRSIPKYAGKQFHGYMSVAKNIWPGIEAMPADTSVLLEALRDSSLDVFMKHLTTSSGNFRQYQPDSDYRKYRQIAALHLGVNLAKEWRFTEEYCEKKTTKELLQLGRKLGIFDDPKAQAYLFETLGKKRGKFESCNKKELVAVFMKSGADLAGKVPDEILDIPGLARAGAQVSPERTCRVCGCTDEYGCDGGCEWVEDDLCSSCKLTEQTNACGMQITESGRCSHLLGRCPEYDCCRECSAVECKERCERSAETA